MSHEDLISMHELFGFNVNEGAIHRIDKVKRNESEDSGKGEWRASVLRREIQEVNFR